VTATESTTPAHEPRSALEASPSLGPWRLAGKRFRSNWLAVGALGIVVIIAVVAVGAPLIQRYPQTQIGFPPLEGPSSAHWFGTDALGRDLWSRVVNGARLSLLVGLGSQLVAISIGLIVGSVAGYRGGIVDALLMRITDVTLSLPALLLALLFLAVLGASTLVVILAIGIGTWPISARLVRSQVLQIRGSGYVEAATVIGCSPTRVLFSHVLRNTLGPLLVLATFGIPQAITTEAVLSFVGLGPPPPNPSWGRLLADSFGFLRTSPHYVLFPALAMSLTLLAFNFVGDGVRDAMDPRGSD
jgi:ABC-type dipeptide/oligopeptide/nickel transport system permease subunit